MATIKDVAKKANVSVATVSRVLNGSPKVSNKAREAVLVAQQELNFYLNANARALAHQDSETIGVVVSDLSDPYFGLMVKSCENSARANNCTLIVSQGFHDEQREINAIESLISHQCRGLIVHALKISDEKLITYMKRFNSMVLINRVLKGFEDRCININNVKGGYIATRELILNGHKKIAFVTSSHTILDARERVEGYKQALHEANIEVNENLIVKTEPYLEGGALAAYDLLNMKNTINDFTAIACYNDYMAAGIIAKFTEAGYKIPDDISITGFDDLYLSRCLNPSLTTVNQPVSKMAIEATELSIHLFKGKPYKLPDFNVSLTIRKSIKKIN